MTKTTTNYLPSFPFWNFSCEVYGQNQQALLNLQHRYGLNINMVLFACWYAASNQGLLSKVDIKQLLSAIQVWHERIVLPLRRMRNGLKEVYRVNWAQPVREEVLVAELKAEQIEQLLLVDAGPHKASRQRKAPLQRAAHACQNMGAYYRLLHIYLDEADCLVLKNLLRAVFPELSEHDCLALCRSVFLDKQKKSGKQMQLELLNS